MNKLRFIFAVLSLCAALPAEVLYQTTFAPAELKSWTLIPQARAAASPEGNVLNIDVPDTPAAKAGRHTAAMPFDLTPYKGKPLLLRVECRARNVSRPAQEWNGVKFMLHYLKDGRNVWRSPSHIRGSFDWKPLEISFIVPDGVEGGKLLLGLEGSSGLVSFRNLTITARNIAEVFPPQPLPENFKAVYTDRVRNQPPLRGAMSPATLRDGDLEELAAWGAKLVRWQLVRNWGKQNSDRDVAEYGRWIDANLDLLDRVLDRANGLGLKVIIDLHSPPGGRTPDLTMLNQKRYLDAFILTWEKIARRMKDKPALWGYDLVNEPMQSRPAATDYLTAQRLAAEAIRKIDPETPIIIESNDWCSPRTYSYLTPLPLPNIIYQVHMYWPGGYTHQGVNNNWGAGGREKLLRYPDENYHKERLRAYLQPVIDFQKRYGARIYVGEFSAVRWAPGADRYLEDLISLFEEYRWDWSYHAFREWSGWSVEHADDPAVKGRVTTETARKKVLLKYFRQP